MADAAPPVDHNLSPMNMLQLSLHGKTVVTVSKIGVIHYTREIAYEEWAELHRSAMASDSPPIVAAVFALHQLYDYKQKFGELPLGEVPSAPNREKMN